MTLMAADPQGWSPREGQLLPYRVNLRFGDEVVAPPPSAQAKKELKFDGDDDPMPAGWKFGRVSGVAVNAQGEVFAFHRGHRADPMIIYDAKGRFLRSWGKGMFTTPHGLRIDPAGNVWTTDVGSHEVKKFTQKGELLLTLGKKGQAGATRDTFNKPTDIAFAKNGDFYVSDGYGNTRVVKFSKDGKYLLEWGKAGRGQGEFNTPHSVQTDSKGTVYVSDRENNRIQIFSADGKFLRMWTHLGSTQNLFITPDDQLWMITHREAVEAGYLNTLGGRIFKVDMATGRIIASIESPGHWIHVTPDRLVFIASLTGNVMRWYPVKPAN